MTSTTTNFQCRVQRAIGNTWQVVRDVPVGVGGYRTEIEVVSTHHGHHAAARECGRRNGGGPMKAAELTVGLEVAITEGTSPYERRTTKATKCEVIAPAAKGQVKIKLLEDARSPLGQRYAWRPEEWKKAGETMTVETRYVWMPWANLETRADNERRQAEQKDAAETASEAKLASIQGRLDRFAGEVDETLAWGGHRGHSVIGDPAASLRQMEKYVRIPTEALEAILDKLDGGS